MCHWTFVFITWLFYSVLHTDVHIFLVEQGEPLLIMVLENWITNHKNKIKLEYWKYNTAGKYSDKVCLA